jgi:hypothetical protein
LAGNVNFEALRYVPVTFAPDCCCERSLHVYILSQDADLPDRREGRPKPTGPLRSARGWPVGRTRGGRQTARGGALHARQPGCDVIRSSDRRSERLYAPGEIEYADLSSPGKGRRLTNIRGGGYAESIHIMD